MSFLITSLLGTTGNLNGCMYLDRNIAGFLYGQLYISICFYEGIQTSVHVFRYNSRYLSGINQSINSEMPKVFIQISIQYISNFYIQECPCSPQSCSLFFISCLQHHCQSTRYYPDIDLISSMGITLI